MLFITPCAGSSKYAVEILKYNVRPNDGFLGFQGLTGAADELMSDIKVKA